MTFRSLERLNVTSRVTVWVFLFQVVVAAGLAMLTGAFQTTFPLALFCVAIVQALSAPGSRPMDPHQLNEWDGVLWLAALGLALEIS
jgi:hypothetical protein